MIIVPQHNLDLDWDKLKEDKYTTWIKKCLLLAQCQQHQMQILGNYECFEQLCLIFIQEEY